MTLIEAYAVLHVRLWSSEVDCRAARRRLQRRHHPDVTGTSARAAKINVAFEVIREAGFPSGDTAPVDVIGDYGRFKRRLERHLAELKIQSERAPIVVYPKGWGIVRAVARDVVRAKSRIAAAAVVVMALPLLDRLGWLP
jgi:hypothetical protein